MREVVEVPVLPEEIDYLHIAHGNEELALLWRWHVEQPTERTTAALMEGYQWLVRSIARKGMGMMYHQAGLVIDRDDLMSLANVGLFVSLQRYSIGSAASFSTYARRRMWGEIVDEMRRLSLVKRAKYHELKEAGELPRIKSFTELGAGLGDTTPRRRWDDWVAWEERVLVDVDPAVKADEEMTQEILEAVERALASRVITDREREIFELYYFGGVPQHEIGARNGVTEARISQILKGTRQKLYRIVVRELPYMRARADSEDK